MPDDGHRGPAQSAQWDQMEAARRDVLASMADVAPAPLRWSRPEAAVLRVVERMLDRLADPSTPTDRVCPHARHLAFDRGPRPLVLDTAPGILMCRDQCYPRWAAQPAPGEVACLGCGCAVPGVARPDLVIAYGPILVLATLCPICREQGGD
ncbi:MAG: hypothetical protein WCF36_21915 [Candidatus Nanopelagicales bacterium]